MDWSSPHLGIMDVVRVNTRLIRLDRCDRLSRAFYQMIDYGCGLARRNFFVEDRAAWTCFSTSPGFGMKKRFTAERPLTRQIRKIEEALSKS